VVTGASSGVGRAIARDVEAQGAALAYRSIPLQSAYCASNAAVRGFTGSLGSELDRRRSNICHHHAPAPRPPGHPRLAGVGAAALLSWFRWSRNNWRK